MNKKLLAVGFGFAILAALLVAGIALAQKPTPTAPYGVGMMGWRGEDGYGPMHEAMQEAIAEALGITHEELEERIAAGETVWSIAQEKGLSQAEFFQLMSEARSKALAKLVEQGVLTQEQADWMQERMTRMTQRGFGNGIGGCMGVGFGGGRRGPGRWNTQP